MTDVRSDINEIAQSIWETLFSFPLESADVSLPDDVTLMTGCVQIEGAWNGAVTLQCTQELATALAGELFGPDATTTADEVRDTIGELTNMLAGNIKALLTEPSRISLPAVAFGGDYDLSIIGTQEVATVGFRCAGTPILVTLLQKVESEADPAT